MTDAARCPTCGSGERWAYDSGMQGGCFPSPMGHDPWHDKRDEDGKAGDSRAASGTVPAAVQTTVSDGPPPSEPRDALRETVYRRIWAMPSSRTFNIPPARDFIARHIKGLRPIVDPFAGSSMIADYRNDLRDGVDAEVYCRSLLKSGLGGRMAAVLFDPPYSPRQISECYKSVGLKCGIKETQNGSLYKRVRRVLDQLLMPGGKALSFGWNSTGFGYRIDEIMLIAHGGAHNDTICLAETKCTLI